MKTRMLFVSAALVTAMACPALAQEASTTTSTTVVKEKSNAGMGAGVVGGAATGALVGGPLGAILGGGVLGGAAGSTLDPPAEVQTYVRTTKVEPVIYEGPVTVGTVVPETITVYQVPNNERYRWTYVNHKRILIDRHTNTIVAVMNDDE